MSKRLDPSAPRVDRLMAAGKVVGMRVILNGERHTLSLPQAAALEQALSQELKDIHYTQHPEEAR